MRGPIVQLYGKPENTDSLRRELEKKGYDVVVVQRDHEGVYGKYHTENMRSYTEIRSMLLGIEPAK